MAGDHVLIVGAGDCGTRAALRIRGLDPDSRTVDLSDESTIGYARLLLATGTRARQVAIPGGASVSRCAPLPTRGAFEPCSHAKTRLLVIGGGFVGLEIAAAARRLGAHVTVVDFAHELMSRVVPRAVGRAIGDRHVAEGVDLRLGDGIDRLTTTPAGAVAELDDGSVVRGDLVVAGVGAFPNTPSCQYV